MPSSAKIRNIASMKPKSPTRLVTNAFLPATARRVALEPERDEQVRAEPDALPPEEGDEEAAPSTSTSIEATNRFRYAKNRREARVAVHVADRVEVDQRRRRR